MKTRIISGAVIVLVCVAVLTLTTVFSPTIFIVGSILAAIAVYEALYATGIVKNKLITAVGSIYSFFYICRSMLFVNSDAQAAKLIYSYLPIVIFVLIQLALYLKFHKDIKLEGMMGMIILPILISFGFESLCSLVNSGGNFIYVILVLCFSAIADTGAYFVGVAIGKHKMAPVISPKKSWEGLVGGIISSVLVTLGVCLLYNKAFGLVLNIPLILAITPVFVLIGVLGDLTASLIKRKCEIKDFGKLIPGHGGILDRFDSILMISASFGALLENFSLIK